LFLLTIYDKFKHHQQTQKHKQNHHKDTQTQKRLEVLKQTQKRTKKQNTDPKRPEKQHKHTKKPKHLNTERDFCSRRETTYMSTEHTWSYLIPHQAVINPGIHSEKIRRNPLPCRDQRCQRSREQKSRRNLTILKRLFYCDETDIYSCRF